MKWYRTANSYDENIVNHRDFIGFHCQKSPVSEYDGFIMADYGREYFMEILDGLPFNMRDKAMEMGLMNGHDDYYSEEFDQWTSDVEYFLKENNVRWIFTSENRQLDNYGDYCYYILMPESNIIATIADPNVNDFANAYVYISPPQYIEIQEE